MPNVPNFSRIMAGLLLFMLAACENNPVETFETHNERGELERYQRHQKDLTKEGLYQLFSPDGKLLEEAHYHANKLNGEKKYFYPDGKVESIEHYQNDTLNGDFQKFLETGTLELQQHYEKGAMQGLSIRYYPNGKIMERVTIRDNDEYGPFQEYYENGNLKTEGTYISNEEDSALEDGELREYDENGELIRIADCHSGVCITRWRK